MSSTSTNTKIDHLNRDEKLFYISGLRQISPKHRVHVLKILIEDEDPVVRGKAALAMEDCPPNDLLQSADVLIESDRDGTTILGLELLRAVNGVDFSDRLRPLLQHGDERVVKTVLDAAAALPRESLLVLLEDLFHEHYDPGLDRALERLIRRVNHPDLLPSIRDWFEMMPVNNRSVALRSAAGLPGDDSDQWVKSMLDETTVPDKHRSIIRRLLELDSDGS